MQHPPGQQRNWLENQESNLFFDNHGEVSAVIDWDKAEFRSRAEEVIRAMHLSLGLEPARCLAFLSGYRQVAKLPPDRLQQAAASYGHQRACGLWLYETIYLDHDDRPKRFLTPGRFVPFDDQWEPLRAALAQQADSYVAAPLPTSEHRRHQRHRDPGVGRPRSARTRKRLG